MAKYKLGIYEKALPTFLSWEEKLLETKTADFDYLEISVDESDDKLKRLDWSREERRKMLDISFKIEIPFGSMCLSGLRRYPLGSTNKASRAKSLEIMEKACILCLDLGIRYIQVGGYDVYYEESTEDTVNFFKETLAKSAKLAADYGVVLGFETMETPFMDTVGKSLKYVNLIDSPYLNIYPDMGNLNNAALKYHHSVTEDIDKGKGKIIAAHIKETKPGFYRELPFGTGEVNFDKLIGACWKNGARRYVTELWYTGQASWRKDILFASSLARNVLNKLDK
jgi:L-ribulose-5-phosphate 3-epimerase